MPDVSKFGGVLLCESIIEGAELELEHALGFDALMVILTESGLPPDGQRCANPEAGGCSPRSTRRAPSLRHTEKLVR